MVDLRIWIKNKVIWFIKSSIWAIMSFFNCTTFYFNINFKHLGKTGMFRNQGLNTAISKSKVNDLKI